MGLALQVAELGLEVAEALVRWAEDREAELEQEVAGPVRLVG